MRMRPSLIITLGLLSGLTPFAIDLYLPSLPSIARDLGSSMEMAQLSVTLYLAVFALSQVFMGPLSDMLGRRATLGAGLLLFVIGAQLLMVIPILVTALAPAQAGRLLDSAQGWLERNNRVITIAVSLIFGLWFVWKGVTGLMG